MAREAKISEKLFKTIRRIQIQTTHLADDILAGAYHSAFKGKGIEFEEVREYQPGDDIRSIDWNVTARMNHPFVKIFKEERELTVLLVIDASCSCHFGQKDKTKSELIAEVGALLAFSAIKNNDKVGLILFTDHIEKYLPPRKGLRHVLRIIRELLYYSPKNRGTNLAKALAFAGKVQKHSAVCFVLSDYISANFSDEWALLALKQDLIAILIEDTYEKEFPKTGLTHFQDLESGQQMAIDTSFPSTGTLLHANKQACLSNLKSICKKTGTGLMQLSTNAAPLPAIKRFFNSRSLLWH